MPFDASSMMGLAAATAGDASGWPGGTAVSRPVTDLSPHVSGGPSAANVNANTNSTDEQKKILWLSATTVLTAMALLWILGAVVFRGITI